MNEADIDRSGPADEASDAEEQNSRGDRYHHGALREALLVAGEAELRDSGIERFSLRSVAKRAGVSHAAPAHHFGDVNGLLTALAAEGFRRFVSYQRERRAAVPAEARSQLAAAGLAYVAFAEEHTALFRLMFSSDRPDCRDTQLEAASLAAFADLSDLVERIAERSENADVALRRDILTVWGLSHGIANLMSSGQMFGLKSVPKAERDEILAEIFARAVRT